MTLAPGDVILTGTPEGVVNVDVGDEVVCEIEGIGRLVNTIVGDAEFGRDGRVHERSRNRMRVEHLIDGKAGRRPRATSRPSIRRRRRCSPKSRAAARPRSTRRWRRRRRHSRPGRRRRAAERAEPDAQARRPDRGARARARRETETRDTGQVIAQTGKQLVPRAADNFHYFAEMCTRVDGHTYPTPTHLNYTLFHPVGVCALISPVERAVHDRDLEGRAVPGASATPRC